MSVTSRTKFLLEMVFVLGVDAFLASGSLKRCLLRGGGWDHTSSFVRQMRRVQAAGLLETDEPSGTDWIPRITEKGKELFANRLDPVAGWKQEWDGNWRSVTFDIPASGRKERARLDSWLEKMRFGHLQGSLWITASSYSNWGEKLESLEVDPRSVVFMEGRPLGKLSDSLIVERSWDFERLNRRYERYLEFVQSGGVGVVDSDPAEGFVDWFRKESTLWQSATEADPFLPEVLLPRVYSGKEAWEAKQSAIASWKQALGSGA